jgi:glycyl-tRNA synthetase (class II)
METNSLLDDYNKKMEELKNVKPITTRAKIIEVDNALQELTNWIKVKNIVAPIELSYWKSSNINLIKNEVEAIRSTIEPSEKFTEFTTKREDIAKKYCKKDEVGTPDLITTPMGTMQYQFDPEDQTKFNVELQELLKEYEEVLVETNKREILVDEFIKKSVDTPAYNKLDLTQVGDVSLDPWFNLLHNEGLFDDSNFKKE